MARKIILVALIIAPGANAILLLDRIRDKLIQRNQFHDDQPKKNRKVSITEILLYIITLLIPK